MRSQSIAFCLVLAASAALAQTSVVYENARLITGDGTPPIENGSIIVTNGRISAIGKNLTAPANAGHTNLTGKTVIAALINVHVHIGYEGYTSWGAQNYTEANVLDHLRREAFYGVAATQSVGSSPIEESLKFQKDQQAGKFPPASLFFFTP